MFLKKGFKKSLNNFKCFFYDNTMAKVPGSFLAVNSLHWWDWVEGVIVSIYIECNVSSMSFLPSALRKLLTPGVWLNLPARSQLSMIPKFVFQVQVHNYFSFRYINGLVPTAKHAKFIIVNWISTFRLIWTTNNISTIHVVRAFLHNGLHRDSVN